MAYGVFVYNGHNPEAVEDYINVSRLEAINKAIDMSFYLKITTLVAIMNDDEMHIKKIYKKFKNGKEVKLTKKASRKSK